MAVLAMHPANGRNERGYSGGGRSPVAIGATIAVHALVVGVFLLMPREVIAPYVPQILIGNQIPLDPPPPPEAQPQPPETKLPAQPAIDPVTNNPDDLVKLPNSGEGPLLPPGGTGTSTGTGGGVILPPIEPVHEPVLAEPGIDPRAMSAFQPDYPGSMIRQGVEGSVTVRVSIGVDGKVTGVQRLSATDEAFWIATQRHAMRKWRFRPATRDGVPVPGTKVLTVHFKLTDR
ncbi:MAG TPA: energy transducer TonB [Sphingobium sp.]|nr:energy transducer TonB [Sphingobium sp.]